MSSLWTEEEALFAQHMRQRGATNADISRDLETVYGSTRSPESVSHAFRRGTIDKLANREQSHAKINARVKATDSGITKDGWELGVEANRPYTIEEIAEIFGVDMDQWTATKHITNTWAGNFQTKVWWAPKAPVNSLPEKWDEFLEETRQRSLVVPGFAPEGDLLYEIVLSDAHIGMLGWGPETGEDYDLNIGIARYMRAFYDLLERRPDGVERFLFVVGQDLAHFDKMVDGKGGATFAGTQQDVDTRWQKLFVAICAMVVDAIEAMANLGPVDVIVQPGNHDTQTTFYVGQYLQAYFQNDANVRIDNTPKSRKYYRYGCTLIGFAHGHQEKGADYHGLMANEAPQDWAETSEREWHLGHRHHEAVKQSGPCRVRIMRALTGTDAWHSTRGYAQDPGAHAFIWHRTLGLRGQVYYRVPESERKTDDLGVVLTG